MDKQSLSKSHNSKSVLRVWKAILIGWLVVNIPALIIMLGILIIGLTIKPSLWWLFLIIGSILGWTWWSFTVPCWRRWAHRNGTNPDKLQKVAVATGLTWAKGSVFEKTEAEIGE